MPDTPDYPPDLQALDGEVSVNEIAVSLLVDGLTQEELPMAKARDLDLNGTKFRNPLLHCFASAWERGC